MECVVEVASSVEGVVGGGPWDRSGWDGGWEIGEAARKA